MSKYFMLGSYSPESIRDISEERTQLAIDLVKKYRGTVDAIYILLGEYDLAMIVEFPDSQSAVKASIALTKETGILFTTLPAMTIDEFDKMIEEI